MAKNKKVLMVGTLTCLALTLSVGVASASWGDVLQKYLVKDEATLQSNDVTKNDFWIRDAHSGTAITPKKQVNYLTEI
ncbi:hypothetical protein [Paenibacillus medicaginis]|uniref:Uncharacterized protein n=1 Tax=Paenibacillus medicaginis TaxID=1470560 RepID=A0ABV5C810_9BACL